MVSSEVYKRNTSDDSDREGVGVRGIKKRVKERKEWKKGEI